MAIIILPGKWTFILLYSSIKTCAVCTACIFLGSHTMLNYRALISLSSLNYWVGKRRPGVHVGMIPWNQRVRVHSIWSQSLGTHSNNSSPCKPHISLRLLRANNFFWLAQVSIICAIPNQPQGLLVIRSVCMISFLAAVFVSHPILDFNKEIVI